MSEPGELERWASLVRRVDDLGPAMERRTDAELRALRHVLSGRLAGGEDAGQAMAEGFAAGREAARRTTGYRYRDSDVMAGAEMAAGRAVDTQDDGMNHFTALLPAYGCAVLGQTVHYVTTSTALAQRQFRDVERLCDMLGLQIGLLSGTAVPSPAQSAGSVADVMYGGYREFAYDYLRNYLRPDPPESAKHELGMAIIDQIDAVLVDKADLPLVIRAGRAGSAEEVVWARITVRDYFRTYSRLGGLSGVTGRAGLELERLYGLCAVSVPSGRPRTRVDHPDVSFDEAAARSEALVAEAAERHQRGQPVVIGVVTAEDGQAIGELLDRGKIQHCTAVRGDDEVADTVAAAAVMAQAGRPGSITVVTADACRGFDIPLSEGAIPPDTGEAASSAGLAVLVAGRSRSRRSDDWLRGLAGRRGESGESRFFLSLQDPLLRGLQSRAWAKVPARIRRRADGAPLAAAQASVVDRMQQRAEEADFARLLGQQAVEDVESAQRADFYSWREKLLWEGDLKRHVGALIDETAELLTGRYEDPEQLLDAIAALYTTRLTIADAGGPGHHTRAGDPADERGERVKADAHAAYERHEQFTGEAALRAAERRIICTLLNGNWSRHLATLETMRGATGSGLSRDDWLSAYSAQATKRYTAMVQQITQDIVGYVMHSEPDTQ